MGIGIGSFNVGNLVEGFCDAVGLPEAFGDIGSGVANYLTGNFPGMMEDAIDLGENLVDNSGGGFLREVTRGPARGQPGDGLDFCPAGSEPAKPSAQPEPSSPLAPAGGPPNETKEKAASMLESLRKGVKPEGMSDEDFARFQLQHEMNEYSAMITLLTNLMKLLHDTNMAVVRNISG
jgi:hypothetical protein